MKQINRWIFIFLCSSSSVFAAVPNQTHPNARFLGPILRGTVTGPLTYTSAFSFGAEAAQDNLRASGTFGWEIYNKHHLKFSAEYLWQELDYAFFAGNNNGNVTQGAVGADYWYAIPTSSSLRPGFTMNAFYARAGNIRIATPSGLFVNSVGDIESYTNVQTVAGSNASGFSPGIRVQPWWGTEALVKLNYDRVHYNTHNNVSPNVRGFGGTLYLNQHLTNHLVLEGLAANRKPFNFYQAAIAWRDSPCDNAWTLKLGSSYTQGKNTLPSSYNLGVTFDYFLDVVPEFRNNAHIKEQFLHWMATPAVYMPEVLAIPDDQVLLG